MNTQTKNEKLKIRESRAVPFGLLNSKQHDIYIERAENSHLWDADGKRYIDFAAGIAVNNTGHRHPKVVGAAKEQLNYLTHAAFQATPYAPYIELCERLNHLLPGDFQKKTYLLSTGAEAVENAVKIARAATGRSAFIAFSGAFHGRTMMAMSLTGKAKPYKNGFGPLFPEVYHAPFPVPYHGVKDDDALEAIENIFKYSVDPSQVAGIIVEPVQGEGGFYPASKYFMQALRKVCDDHGILLIADEIQTGFARTGRMFAMEHFGVAADIVTMAKGLGGGFPIAAVSGRSEIMDQIPLGGVGSTYGGNPVSCAASLAVLDVIEEERLIDRSEMLGRKIKHHFEKLKEDSSLECIGDVRGLGAMIAIEFVKDRSTKEPWPDVIKPLIRSAEDHGLILLPCGVWGNSIRILTPLTIPESVLEEGLAIFEKCLRSVVAESGASL
tara:strand:- start:9868 stop:11187 length:1320 start_codon:yes stop_codon:yes gene_type:complete